MNSAFIRYCSVAALGASLLAPLSAQATSFTLFDSITGSTPGGADYVDPAHGIGPIYMSFSTGASAVYLSEIDGVFRTDSAGLVAIALLASNGNTPGAFIADLGTIAVSDTAYATLALTGLSSALAASTRYWLEFMRPGADTTVQMPWTGNSSGYGVASERYVAGPYAGFDTDGPYEMKVIATDVLLTTPLPAALPMFAGGAAALAFLVRRRRSAQ